MLHEVLLHELYIDEKVTVMKGRQVDATMEKKLAVLIRGAVRMKEMGLQMNRIVGLEDAASRG